jgi:DNA transformation protein and related proteins
VTTKPDGFKDFVLDQLSGLPGLTYRTMFGGYGLYQCETFFGIIHRGRLYFKTDRMTSPRYHNRGMKPFKPTSTQMLKNYYEVPVEVLEAPDDLTAWASHAAQR